MRTEEQNISFDVIAKQWLNIKRMSLKFSSYIKYENVINQHILPYFEEVNIYDIDDEIICDYFHQLNQSESLSTSMLKTIRYISKALLTYSGIRYGIDTIDFSMYQFPKAKSECVILSDTQRIHLEQYCERSLSSVSVGMLLALYAGLRIGEVCALQWKDIDLRIGILSINKTVQRLKNDSDDSSKTKLYVTKPKTDTSSRSIPLQDYLKSYLQRFYDLVNHDPLDYILTQTKVPMDPRTLQKQFVKVCSLYEFQVNFHVLRHSFATYCVMAGVDVKSLSEILGHSDISTTLKLYVHSSMEYKFLQMKKIQPFLRSQNTEFCE